MTEIAILQTAERDRAAGLSLGQQIRDRFSESPDAIIVFAAPGNDYRALLSAIAESTGTTTIVGCSSAGEFTNDEAGVGLTNATAIHAPDMRFAASVGVGLTRDYAKAAHEVASRFQANRYPALPHRAALVLVDALAGHAEEFVNALTVETAGSYRFFGGGAGDDARFQKTFVFCGTHVYQDAAVALEMVSKKPIGVGARHGWRPASPPLRVTEADASRVVSFNAAPAVEAFEDHAESTAQKFDHGDPMPFFLHNIVGVDTGSGHKLRVPLGVADGGGIVCAAEVPAGATTHIMSTATASAAEAAAEATRDAVHQVTSEGYRPKAALFFDCVATRLRLGQSFDQELGAVAAELGGIPFAGFNSYGQIVRAEGQFSGFHNCTAVVCVLPD
jgi:hypothetical protein